MAQWRAAHGPQPRGQIVDDLHIPVIGMSGDDAARSIATSMCAEGCPVQPIELAMLLAAAVRHAHAPAGRT